MTQTLIGLDYEGVPAVKIKDLPSHCIRRRVEIFNNPTYFAITFKECDINHFSDETG